MGARDEARRYLMQIRKLERMIDQKRRQIENLEEMATSGGAIRYDKDKVISSVRTDATENKVIRYVDLQAELKQDIDRYVMMRDRIIREIHELEDVRFITILHDYYVDDKDMMAIADKLHYSYDHVVHLNMEALEEFWRRKGEANETN